MGQGLAAAPLRLARNLLVVRKYFPALLALVLIFELAFGVLIILRVPYTEIDWVAYMEEVGGAFGGEWDYAKLRGGTGPLVYPAGFVYLYGALWWLTDWGADVRLAQYIFLGLYLCTVAAAMLLYHRSRAVPQWVMLLLCVSKRLRSIFYLRLFNDGVATLLLLVAMLFFQRGRWKSGCFWFSSAVSIKMNILLFAPALLLLLLQETGLHGTFVCLSICAGWQLVLGAPFLYWNWWSYLRKAFEFSRVFFFKWTVNWKFLAEDIFVSKRLATLLLALHLLVLAVFVRRWWRQQPCIGKDVRLNKRQAKNNNAQKRKDIDVDTKAMLPDPARVVDVLFVANFVGIAFARTLHYQFYSWYFHSLPYLLWRTKLPTAFRISVLIGAEVAFNVFPATPASSLMLQVAHAVLLLALLFATGDRDTAAPTSTKKHS